MCLLHGNLSNAIINGVSDINVTGIINCCSGKGITVKDLVKDYLKGKNKHITLNTGYYPYPDHEPMCFWGDSTKLSKIL